jgi:hypothetical protein
VAALIVAIATTNLFNRLDVTTRQVAGGTRGLSRRVRPYRHTQDDNALARALDDNVARFSGFIRYEYPL